MLTCGRLAIGLLGALMTPEQCHNSLRLAAMRGRLVACAAVAYRRRFAGRPPLDRAEAAIWELRYTIGTGMTALLLGLSAARSLVLNDAICSLMAIGIAFGFSAGIVARLSLRPVVAVVDLLVIGLPAIVVAFG